MKQIQKFGWLHLLPPEDVEPTKEHWLHCVNTGENFEREHRFKQKDGLYRNVLAIGRPIKDETGKIKKWVGINLDITERKQAEETLRESEERFRILFEHAADSVVLIEAETQLLVDCNDHACQNLGYTREEFLRLRVQDLEVAESPEEVERHARTLKQGGEDTFETQHRAKNGDIHDILVKVSFVSLGGKDHLFGIWHDITKRKRMEDELRESEEKYRLITETSVDTIYQFDTEGNVVFMNRAGVRMYGYEREEIIGRNFSVLVSEEWLPTAQKWVGKVLSGQNVHGELDVKHREGYEFPIYFSMVPVRRKGEIVGLAGISRDISEQKQAEEALQKAHDELEARVEERTAELKFHSEIVKNMSEGVYLIRASDGVIVYTNPRSERIFGYGPDEMVGRHVSIVNAPMDRDPEEIAKEIMGRIAKQGYWRGEINNIKKDGTSFWCYASVSVFDHSEYGKVLVSIHTDITERKRTEEKLKKQAAFVMNNPAPVFQANMDSTVVLCNPAAKEVFGHDINGEPLPSLFTENRRSVFDGLSDTELFQFEETIGVKAFLFTIKKDVSTRSLYIYGSDITERKQTEGILKESEERFRTFSEQSQLGITILQEGQVKYANEALSEIVEYSVEEMLGWEADWFFKLVYAEDQAFAREQYEMEFVDSDAAKHVELRVVARGGAIKWIDIYSKAILYDGRRALMVTLIDITEKKKAEEEARVHRQQLIQADKLASLGVLVAGVAHEINNPNQIIMSGAELIGETWRSVLPVLDEYYEKNGDFLVGGVSYERMRDKVSRFVGFIVEGAQRIDGIVSDLKNFSRREDYGIIGEVEINAVVRSTVTLTGSFIMRATNRFEVDLGRDLPRVRGSFQRLEQVVINLIENACQALSSREKEVWVRTRYDEGTGSVLVVVEDEGLGISEEDLRRIKDPFFTTKRASGGTGLGLSISNVIAEEHGGRLEYRSAPGKGTTVILRLPAAKS